MRDVNMDINTVGDRFRYFPFVFRHGRRRTDTFFSGNSGISARAHVHRRDKNKIRGKSYSLASTRNVDYFIFKRLAQTLDDFFVEFRELVEEEHSAVRERDLPWFRNRSSADKR